MPTRRAARPTSTPTPLLRDASAEPADLSLPRSVTILSSNWGGGHAMVARAVRDALIELRPHWHVDTLDFFDRFVGRRLSRSVATSYLYSVKSAPFLYDLFYRATQKVGEHSRLQAQLNTIGRENLAHYLATQAPDLVVSTYPTPGGVLSSLKLDGTVSTLSVVILTDFAVHSQWTHRGVDLYIVGAERVRQGLIERGIPAERVQATGIPIRQGFEGPHPPRPPDGPVLVMVGAVGMLRNAFRLCKALTRVAERLVVVCGKDSQLQEKLSALPAAAEGRLDVRGFVEDVSGLMAEARLLVGKPGGITASEALAMGLPMVTHAAIPGQEEENERFLVEAGAARAPGSIAAVCREVSDLLAHPEDLRAMSERAAALGRPRSAHDAAQAILSLIDGPDGQC